MERELVGTGEIADLLGVTRQAVDKIVKTDPSFPPPLGVVGGRRVRVWDLETVRKWIKEHPERGRQ